MRAFVVVLFCIGLLSSCSTTQNVAVNEAKIKQLKEWIDAKELRVIVNTASPISTQEIGQLGFLLPNGSTPNRILLTGGNDYFQMSGENIKADLPYFGTRQLGGEYNYNRGGIKFEGKPKSYKVSYDENKKVYLLKYKINANKESFNITVKVFPNHKAEMYINTSHRTAINFNGFVRQEETVASN